jgi:hypothetical protein
MVARNLEYLIRMSQAHTHEGLTKHQRFRANRKAQGLRLIRLWVPDPHAIGFAEEVKRQAVLLRGTEEEREALEFIEQAAALDDWTK